VGDLAGPELPRSSAAVAEPTIHDPDARGHFGVYGGRFVPEALMAVIEEVTAAYEKARGDQAFLDELDRLQRHYSGRPSPLYEAQRLSEHAGGARLFLKREDLNHTGSHKINNVLGQALLARQMGKTRVIAETGAGQHGVATATACALLGLECIVYMGAVDTARQALNVARMRLLGAAVVSVEAGSKTLKDAINEAFRDWVTNADNTYYCFGTAAGPHPFPTMVRDFQRVIGLEARVQIVEQAGRLPDAVTACVGGGSNAIGIFHAFIDDPGVRALVLTGEGRGFCSGQNLKASDALGSDIAAGGRGDINLIIDEWILLEYACVVLPAQQNAVVESVSKGAGSTEETKTTSEIRQWKTDCRSIELPLLPEEFRKALGLHPRSPASEMNRLDHRSSMPFTSLSEIEKGIIEHIRKIDVQELIQARLDLLRGRI